MEINFVRGLSNKMEKGYYFYSIDGYPDEFNKIKNEGYSICELCNCFFEENELDITFIINKEMKEEIEIIKKMFSDISYSYNQISIFFQINKKAFLNETKKEFIKGFIKKSEVEMNKLIEKYLNLKKDWCIPTSNVSFVEISQCMVIKLLAKGEKVFCNRNGLFYRVDMDEYHEYFNYTSLRNEIKESYSCKILEMNGDDIKWFKEAADEKCQN